MPIVLASNRNIRSEVAEYISKRKQHSEFRVLDAGGAANPWLDSLVDAYIDINPVKSGKKVYQGDINKVAIWDQIARDTIFDFSICTHTIEDIRCPDVAIEGLMKISKAGFIAVPNKHSEFSHIESSFFVGNSHHRWIFTLQKDRLRFIAKMPVTNYFSKKNALLRALSKHDRIAFLFRRLLNENLIPNVGSLGWLQTNLAVYPNELGFIWESSFDWEFINGDFAGFSTHQLANLYVNELGEGL